MKLDRDGRPAISEKQVVRAIKDMLTGRYLMVPTNASDLTRGGRPSHSAGFPDFVVVPITRMGRVWWLEAKRRKARTARKRIEKQAEQAERLRLHGQLVITMPEGEEDPIGWIRNELRARWLI